MYDEFMHEFFDAKYKEAFSTFVDSDHSGYEFTLGLKRRVETLRSIEQDILAIIQTGELAAKQLEEML